MGRGSRRTAARWGGLPQPSILHGKPDQDGEGAANHLAKPGKKPNAMSTRMLAHAQAPLPSAVTPAPGGLLQRARTRDQDTRRPFPAGTRIEDQAAIPPLVRDVLRAPGQPLSTATRAAMESRFGRDFSRVRVHADAQAAESARAIDARAYTLGQDVVFAAGRYAPGTSSGIALLAHELAHTIQQRRDKWAAGDRPGITAATDPTERQAEAMATAALQGKPNIPASSTPLRIARQPADRPPPVPGPTSTNPAADPLANEDPALRRRRLAVAQAARNASEHIRDALARGLLWKFETITIDGVKHQAAAETLAVREARFKQLIADLALLSSELLTAPIPPAWLAAEVEFAGADVPIIEAGGPDAVVKDTKMFYAHRGKALGRPSWLVWRNWFHLDTAPLPTPAVRRRPTSRGVATGIYIHVPDAQHAPLLYRRLTGYDGWQDRGVIVTVWQDDIGCYYHRGDSKIYLPRRP